MNKNSITALLFALSAPLCAQTITGLDHPESVCRSGKFYYVSNLGKELKPSEKDGDGYISKVSLAGKLVEQSFLPKEEKLNAPKGLVAIGNILYLTDVDRVLGYNVDTKAKVFEISIPDATFLNDPVVINKTTLWVSQTDKNKILSIDLKAKSFTYLAPEISGPNGLALSTDKKSVFCVGYGSDSKPNGEVFKIDIATQKSEKIASYQGYLDGVFQHGNQLYFSDWKAFEVKGELEVLNLDTKEVKRVSTIELIGGFADFYIDKNAKFIIIPAMIENKVVFKAL